MMELLAGMKCQGLLGEEASRQAQSLIDQGYSVDKALLKTEGVAEEDVLRFLSKEFGVPLVDLELQPPSREFLAQFPAHPDDPRPGAAGGAGRRGAGGLQPAV